MLKLIIAGSLSMLATVAAAQDDSKWNLPVNCEKQSLTIQVTSLKRMGPGKLTLTFQVENTSNVPLKFGAPVHLVDDQGEEWKYDRGSLVGKSFLPDVKTSATLNFSRDMGGKDAKLGNISSEVLVGAVGKAKNYGRCAWRVQGIPIQ